MQNQVVTISRSLKLHEQIAQLLQWAFCLKDLHEVSKSKFFSFVAGKHKLSMVKTCLHWSQNLHKCKAMKKILVQEKKSDQQFADAPT